MDDHDHPDTNVVNLHRRHGLDRDRREQIARTIFAEEDEIYTFSQGNLVPPAKSPPTAEPEAPEDPFFEEQLRRARTDVDHPAASQAAQEQSEETDAYFAHLASQSATEMARELHPEAAESERLPGSAALAATDTARAQDQRPRPSLRGRIARRRFAVPVAVSSSLALVATAALVLVVAPNGTPLASRAPTSDRAAASTFDLSNPFALLRSGTPLIGQNAEGAHHAAGRRSTGADRRGHHTARPARRSHPSVSHPRHHADRPAITTGTSATTQPPTQTTPASSSSPPAGAASSGDSSGSSGTSGGSQPFGLDGTLAPGHSSIG